MLNLEQVLLDLATPALAVGTGLLYFKRLDRFNRYLLIQTFIYLISDFVVAKTGHNAWMYNINILVEMGFILLAINSLFIQAKMKYLLFVMYLIFIMALSWDISWAGFGIFANDAAIVQGLLLSGILLYVLYREFMGQQRKHVIIACIGTVIYFACTTPCLGIIIYLQSKNAALNQQLFQYIFVLAQSIRYFLVAVSFALQIYEHKKLKEVNPV